MISPETLRSMGYDENGNRVPKPTKPLRESELHYEILAYCRGRGWPVVHSRMDRPTTCHVGTPDFVIALPGGRTLWIEAKSSEGKVSLEQRAWMLWLGQHAHLCAVVHSMDEFISALPIEST